jgi:uncharacterized membrane protein YphA (DoxX/SURF4 family)
MDTPEAPASKLTAAAPWVLAALLAMAFAGSGSQKVFGELAAQGAQHFGYSVGFMVFIGAAELAGAVGLLIPRLSMWAAAGLIIIMAGAVYSHISAGDAVGQAAPAAVLLVLLSINAWLRSDRALFLADG